METESGKQKNSSDRQGKLNKLTDILFSSIVDGLPAHLQNIVFQEIQDVQKMIYQNTFYKIVFL